MIEVGWGWRRPAEKAKAALEAADAAALEAAAVVLKAVMACTSRSACGSSSRRPGGRMHCTGAPGILRRRGCWVLGAVADELDATAGYDTHTRARARLRGRFLEIGAWACLCIKGILDRVSAHFEPGYRLGCVVDLDTAARQMAKVRMRCSVGGLWDLSSARGRLCACWRAFLLFLQKQTTQPPLARPLSTDTAYAFTPDLIDARTIESCVLAVERLSVCCPALAKTRMHQTHHQPTHPTHRRAAGRLDGGD